jgi:hypothetical protein
MTYTYKKNILFGSLVFLVCNFVYCAVSPGFWGRKEYQRIEQVSTPVSGFETISIKTDSANITFAVSDTNDCNVTARITTQSLTTANAMRLAEQTRIKFKFESNSESNSVQIITEKPRTGLTGIIAIAYDINIPPGTNIYCRTSSGKISLMDIKGNVTAVTSMGDIQAQGVTGRMQLDTSYGDIDCNDITSVYTAAKSKFGNIQVVFSDACPDNLASRLETSFGDIVVAPPSTFAGEITAKTSYGKITTDVPVLVKGEIDKKKLRGNIGSPALSGAEGGNAWLDLKTGLGNIKIK